LSLGRESNINNNNEKMATFTAENPLKIYYFDVPGRGEPLRLACTYGNLPFTDIRLNGEQFQEMKALGELPFGQLPVIEVAPGKFVGQSAAILRLIGKLTGLYPVDDHVKAAVIDSLLDQLADMMTGVGVIRFKERYGFDSLTEEALANARKKLYDKILPMHLEYFENFLRQSPTGWLAGTEGPSIADFMLVPRLQWLASPRGFDPNMLESFPLLAFPLLTAMMHRFLELPAIKEYYDAHHGK
jgi:glutathione S-transferase